MALHASGESKEEELNLQIMVGWPGGSALVEDYLEGERRVGRFFQGGFRDPGAYQARAAEVDGRFTRHARERALSFLAPPSDAASRALGDFVEGGGLFVTTGQQPGLFTGPLYTLYKALSAIGLARSLSGLLGRPVLPLFWVASEDHDWDEADHARILDVQNDLRTFRVPAPEEAAGRSLHRIPLPDASRGTVDEFLEALPTSDFSGPYFDWIRDAYRPGRTLPESFLALLQEILEEHPILFLDAANPKLKDASLPILLRELLESEAHEAALAGTAGELETEGYHVQVPILEGAVNLFLEGPGGRERLYRHAEGFRLHRSGTMLTGEELRRRAEGDPSVLTPNVLLRPVVESLLLPTVAYVAGPGELAYYAQLRELYRCHGSRMPVIVPRHSATLVESKVGKVLQKFRLTPEELHRPFHELAAEMARDEVPDEIRRALGEVRGAVGKGASALAKAVQEVDPTLKGPVSGARNAAFSAFDDLERKVVQAVKRRNETALEQIEKAQRHLFPLGKPQERVLNVFYYLTRYGPGLTAELLASFPVALGPDSA